MTAPPGPKVVLLVEDDIDLREVMQEMFALKGIPVAIASNGAEALGYLRNAPPPALILLDLMMPVMDGATFRKEQRAVEAWSEIPVVVLSADRDLGARAKELGAQGFVRKPADLAALITLVNRFLGSETDKEQRHGSTAAHRH